MGLLLLAVTVILFGINLLDSLIPNVVLGILFIVSGALLILDHRGAFIRQT